LGRRGSIFFHCSSDNNRSRIHSFSQICRKSTSAKHLRRQTYETASRPFHAI
jgi:hypothetical protein